ncbi:hypothetical protein BU26DRAFT_205271 [Trematosphaeria pertusa]|uniref:Uncharacterized protein n=1 Tax=Trematosphaeria pertusa TaxID=390896 RepID=A0A6A6HS87_9PLEO|nr:uncharacterized protein BU26DRAFT_205271 [Trematosphaeria pertusa]KAF2240672.1 hypothetical protein BU26DRAFT_205271 [Trematosphaeria pertusa]
MHHGQVKCARLRIVEDEWKLILSPRDVYIDSKVTGIHSSIRYMLLRYIYISHIPKVFVGNGPIPNREQHSGRPLPSRALQRSRMPPSQPNLLQVGCYPTKLHLYTTQAFERSSKDNNSSPPPAHSPSHIFDPRTIISHYVNTSTTIKRPSTITSARHSQRPSHSPHTK